MSLPGVSQVFSFRETALLLFTTIPCSAKHKARTMNRSGYIPVVVVVFMLWASTNPVESLCPIKFQVNTTAMILIDYQLGTMGWANSTPIDLLRRNAIVLTTFAVKTGMPLVLTTSQETNMEIQGPPMPELAEIAPDAFAKRIKRKGVVSAWDDPDFAAACRNTYRRNFILAGVTTDVCVVATAESALGEGYNVKVVLDGCGSGSEIAEFASYQRLRDSDIRVTSTNAIISELVQDWTSTAGAVGVSLLNG